MTLKSRNHQKFLIKISLEKGQELEQAVSLHRSLPQILKPHTVVQGSFQIRGSHLFRHISLKLEEVVFRCLATWNMK